MDANQEQQERIVAEVYNYTARQLAHEKRSRHEVIRLLTDRGLDQAVATRVVDQMQEQISKAKKSRANKDMLYGALWCLGGTILTLSHIGFIFWGAILFGAIQFFRGVANA